MSIARVLELGVPLAWREATALVVEGVRRAQLNGGTLAGGVALDACLVTRGGEFVLDDRAAAASPDAMLDLVGPLIAACVDPGDLGQAVASGTIVPFLEAYADDTPWRRRRVQIAAVALRAIGAEADRARDNGDAVVDDDVAAAALAASEPIQPAAAASPSAPPLLRSTAPAASESTPAADDATLRRYTRQTPRSSDDLGRREPRPHRLKLVVTARRRQLSVVGARLAIWTAIAVSATAAGVGAWRVAAQAAAAGQRPPIARPDRVASDPGSSAPTVLRTSGDEPATEP